MSSQKAELFPVSADFIAGMQYAVRLCNKTVEFSEKEAQKEVQSTFWEEVVNVLSEEEVPEVELKQSYVVQSSSKNAKLGDIPIITPATTVAGLIASCKEVGCQMLPATFGGPGGLLTGGDRAEGKATCYAFGGRPYMAVKSLLKGFENHPQTYRLDQLKKRKKTAKAVRLAVIGDPGRLPEEEVIQIVAAVKAEGLSLLTYTRSWKLKLGQKWKGLAMASCDNLVEADRAVSEGWRATVVLPGNWSIGTTRFKTPEGRIGIVCPAMLTEKSEKKVTCNTCRICDGSVRGPIIGFPDHGPSTTGTDWRKAPQRKAATCSK